MGLFGPPNVEQMKAKGDVKGLIKALRYQKDARVRQAATEALGAVRDVRAVEPLIAVLKDTDKNVRWAAVKALGESGDARAVDQLIALLKDRNLRNIAADTLGKIGDARAIKPLILDLNDSDPYYCREAAEALRKIGWQPDKDEKGAYYWIILGQWDKCIEIGSPAIKPLAARLKHSGSPQAADALAKIGELSVESLIAVFKDSNSQVREYSAKALVMIGSPSVEPLITALNDGAKDVRQTAEDALGKIGDARAVEPLIVGLKDREEAVRKSAAEALGKIGDARAVEPLITTLTYDVMYPVRFAAAAALVQIGDTRGDTPFITAFNDPNEKLREAAADALVKIGAPAVQLLSNVLRDSNWGVGRLAVKVLEKIGWHLGSDEAGAIYWAIKGEWGACINIGAPAVKALIMGLANTDSPKTRTVIARGLVELYASDKLNDNQKHMILAKREAIENTHEDNRHVHSDSHLDSPAPGVSYKHCSFHDDDVINHVDQGSRIVFPL
jgi:HEAT repeat protein